jgi:hypothetical protein
MVVISLHPIAYGYGNELFVQRVVMFPKLPHLIEFSHAQGEKTTKVVLLVWRGGNQPLV